MQPKPTQTSSVIPIPVKPEPTPEPSKTTDSNPTPVAEAVNDLLSKADGKPISVDDIKESGLSFSDLPPSTPVEVRTDEEGNPVVITAETAAALVLLQDPAALLQAALTNPAEAMKALLSVGADMTEKEREEATKTVIAAVIAGQAAIGAAGVAAASVRRVT